MKYEVEQKFRVEQLDEFRGKLAAMDGSFQSTVEQVDRYFAHPSRDFATTDEAFRLRRDGSQNRITYKGPKLDTDTKTRREIELPLPAGPGYLQEFSELLHSLGFCSVAEVRKHRTRAAVRWRQRVVEVCLDEVAEVGDFVELELVASPEDLAATQQSIRELAQALDLTEAIRASYLELLLDARRRE